MKEWFKDLWATLQGPLAEVVAEVLKRLTKPIYEIAVRPALMAIGAFLLRIPVIGPALIKMVDSWFDWAADDWNPEAFVVPEEEESATDAEAIG